MCIWIYLQCLSFILANGMMSLTSGVLCICMTIVQSENRISAMTSSRSDWCISRQRTWGLPIPAFYHVQSKEPLMNEETINHIKSNSYLELWLFSPFIIKLNPCSVYFIHVERRNSISEFMFNFSWPLCVGTIKGLCPTNEFCCCFYHLFEQL